MDHLISVIVPVYNAEAYLPRCLRAISEQTYRNLEIILVDDGSTDSSGVICEDYATIDKRARVIHQKNLGLWAARNTGQEAAKGDFLFFPDSDDYFHRDTVRVLLDAIRSGGGYEMAIIGRRMTWSADEDVSSTVLPVLTEWSQQRLIETMVSEYKDTCCVFMWNKLYRRSLIENLRSREYQRSQDLDFNLRAFLRLGKAIVIENELYYWVQHNDSLIRSSDALDLYYECRTRIFYRNYMDLPPVMSQYGPLLLRRLYGRMLIWRHRKWRTVYKDEAVKTCRHYIKDTWSDYLFNSHIPLYERIGVISLLALPHLSYPILKAMGK